MKRYIDGFILPIPKHRVAEYQAIAESASKIWKNHGAIEYCECVGDDLNGEGVRSFTEMANATEDETVIFAWAVFESRESRDAANGKIMSDPRIAVLMDQVNPIFDCKRMAHGGFKVIVD